MKVESKKNKSGHQKQLMLIPTKDRKIIEMRKEEKDIHCSITKNRPLTIQS